MGNFSDLDMNNIPESEFAALPEADYVAVITATEKKLSKAGTSHHLVVTYEILDGPYKGRKQFEYMNLWHPTPNTNAIARRDLKKICQALGFAAMPADSAELHNKPVILSLSVYLEEYQGKKQEKNKINDFKPASVGTQFTAPVQQAPAAPAAAPWAK